MRGSGRRIKRTLEITIAFERQVQYKGGRRGRGERGSDAGETLEMKEDRLGK